MGPNRKRSRGSPEHALNGASAADLPSPGAPDCVCVSLCVMCRADMYHSVSVNASMAKSYCN